MLLFNQFELVAIPRWNSYFRRVYNLSIGLKTAERIKKEIGCVHSSVSLETVFAQVKGKDLMEGIPANRVIAQPELTQVLERPFKQIESCIQQSLEIWIVSRYLPLPELCTGGNAQLKGIRERLEKTFQVPVHIDTEPLLAVSKGIAKILAAPQKYRSILL